MLRSNYIFRLKLTEEKRYLIQKVRAIPSRAEGVYVKCFSKMKKIIKFRREIDTITI